ncbi:helix-turn-helix domain-containing protein [Amycolatopsis minnesotensis]|uniref:TetR/AcrR family transcriptional regulator n=1 Tax=Amycolatopsis minnesotensis TaxID=337894 RepID=A0ABN2SCS6_9PSEU
MSPEPQTRARRSDAYRNDERILVAAREVFAELGVDAPVSAIAERAGVGMSALYRRYPSKDDLMRAIMRDTMERTEREAVRALDVPDAWAGFLGFVHACTDTGIGVPGISGAFRPTEEMLARSKRAREAVQVLVERTQKEGGLRADINAHDIVFLLGELRSQRAAKVIAPPGVRERLMGVVLDGLRAPNATPLITRPGTWEDMHDAWRAAQREHP